MANYLLTHYKGKYRILCDVCLDTNDFPRKLDGTYEDNDCYISCNNNIRIHSVGRGILRAYIPSIKQGNSILRKFYRENINESNTELKVTEFEIQKDGKPISIKKESISIINNDLFETELKSNDIIFGLERTDSEILFKFKSKDMNLLETYLEPRTSGANISPFSVKNRPKINYDIPDQDLCRYKELTSKLDKDNMVFMAKYTREFISSLANKNNTLEDIKADMRLKCLQGKNYIHSINQWDNYINYLEKHLCQN